MYPEPFADAIFQNIRGNVPRFEAGRDGLTYLCVVDGEGDELLFPLDRVAVDRLLKELNHIVLGV